VERLERELAREEEGKGGREGGKEGAGIHLQISIIYGTQCSHARVCFYKKGSLNPLLSISLLLPSPVPGFNFDRRVPCDMMSAWWIYKKPACGVSVV
jgi:hypothetical protein